jgi:hypothetical protein
MGPLISPLLPPPASPSNVVNLAEGTAVEIDGLLQRPDFNGKSGVVQSWDPMLRRYNVLLDGSPDGSVGPRNVKIKRGNLRLRAPPPPSSAPGILATTIDLEACLPLVMEQGDDCAIFDASPRFPCNGGDAGSRADFGMTSPEHGMTSSDDAGWFQSWQYCEGSVSPQSWHEPTNVEDEGNMSPSAEQFGGAGVTWDYSSNMMSSTDMIAGFDSQDGGAWQQQIGEMGIPQEGWQMTSYE